MVKTYVITVRDLVRNNPKLKQALEDANVSVREDYEDYKDRRDQEWRDAKELAPLEVTDEISDYFDRYTSFEKKLWQGDAG